ncbi:MAG: Outer membrane receptor protein, partial [Marinimicrobia bacterium 46_43]
RSDVPSYHFIYGGQNTGYYLSDELTSTIKFDLTSQVTRNHQIRTGVEANFHTYHRNNMAIEMSSRTQWQPYIPDVSSSAHDDYTRHPFDFSAYIQDKIELQDFIMNIGLRYDYFDANDYTFSDATHPAQSDTVKASPKSQISPRLGLSFPITDQGFIHFSYGHFFQMPSFYRGLFISRMAIFSRCRLFTTFT